MDWNVEKRKDLLSEVVKQGNTGVIMHEREMCEMKTQLYH